MNAGNPEGQNGSTSPWTEPFQRLMDQGNEEVHESDHEDESSVGIIAQAISDVYNT